jgi:hypothetical protein
VRSRIALKINIIKNILINPWNLYPSNLGKRINVQVLSLLFKHVLIAVVSLDICSQMKISQRHENMGGGQMCCLLRVFDLFVSSYTWRRQSILYFIINRRNTEVVGKAG